MNRRAMIKLACLALPALLVLAACHAEPAAPSITGTAIDGATIGGPFTLTDKDGRTVHWADFKGRYRIVYFGYTFCPDACPTDLGVVMTALKLLAKDQPALAARVQPMFITIDPARDTPKVIGTYAAAFGPRLLGLTGTPAEVDAAAKAFGVYYGKGKPVGDGYLMEHSRFVYLMGPNGEPIEMLPADKGAKAVAADLALMVKPG
jgi:protein SCO1/2